MSKINILSSTIFNKIAAGEVVERPASVVKELVENSIDAGADTISILIRGGGLEEIIVSDNGHGIQKEDITTAFLPHATSKIKHANDLFSISSLGFRGEALASIASIAHVTVKSRYRLEEEGRLLSLKAGKVDESGSYGMNIGTIMSVNNLFFNTPARLKFLKKPRYEENEIIALITKFVLANPNIKFNLKNEKGTLVNSYGNGLQSAVFCIFGNESDNLLKVDASKHGIAVNGYISNTNFYKSNRLSQTVILNGRVVKNYTLTTAINNAYSAFLMKRCFPVVVLSIKMPFEEVDVNVHPSKTDVRFENSNKIFGILYNIIKEKLENYTKEQALSLTSQKRCNDNIVDSDTKLKNNDVIGYAEADNIDAKSGLLSGDIVTRPNATFFNSAAFSGVKEADAGIQTKIQQMYDKFSKTATDYNSTSEELQKEVTATYQEDIDTIAYRVVGQIFGTYIIIEYEEELILIDQHAAAERILFEKLLKEYDTGKVIIQPLLIPYIFTVNSNEQNLLYEQIPKLSQIGIDIEEFGNNSYKLNSLPQLLLGMDITKLIRLILSDKSNVDDPIRQKLIVHACKSAIKGNTTLSIENIKLIIKGIFEKNIPDRCPHGRPAYIKITKNELSKMFKRII